MHMFGLYSFKPLAVARVSGMRFVHVKRRDADPADDVAYLRHASAMSAAIAKNLSGVMSQPSELVHASGTPSDAAAAAAFMESHSQYSFIAVVSLMSLFLVITISATGLLLAFCRKKNAVFTASVKEDADSQFELDDIDNSDTEMCRGDKGECYFHLSDDYDEDSDDTDDDYDPEPRGKTMRERKSTRLTKRSTTFPQIKSMLASCTGDEEITDKEGTKTSTVTTPLIQNTQSVNGSIRSGVALTPAVSESRATTPRCPSLQHQNPHSSNARFRQNARALVCRNPDHQHFQKQHHNCVYSRPHYHHKRNLNYHGGVRPLMARLYRYQLPCAGGGGRLHRSYTIHDIPQTGSESKSTYSRDLGKCGVKIKVQNMEQIVPNNNNQGENVDDSGSLPLHHISTISSSIGQFKSLKADDEDDIFNEDDTTFSNLKLRLEEFHANEAADHDIPPDPYQVQVVGGRVLNTQETPHRVLQHSVGAQGRFADLQRISALSRNNQSIDETIDPAHCDSRDAVTGQRRHVLKPTSTHESIGDRITRGMKPSLTSADSPICNISMGQCSSMTGPNPDQVKTTSGEAMFGEMYSLHGLSSGDANSRRVGCTSDASTARSRPETQPHPAHTPPVPIPPPPSQRSKRPQSQVTTSNAAKTQRTAAAAQREITLQQRKTIPVTASPARDPLVQQIAKPSQHPNIASTVLPPPVSRSSSLAILEETTNTMPMVCPNLRRANSKGDVLRTNMPPLRTNTSPLRTNMLPPALAGRRGDRGGEAGNDDSDNADEVRLCLLQDGGGEDDQTQSLLE